MRAPHPSPNGFTLVEVMVASIILGMTVSAISIMIVNASNLRLGSDHNRQARLIAQEELEDTQHHFFNYGHGLPLINDTIRLDPGEPEQASTLATRNLGISSSNLVLNIDGTPVSIPYQVMSSNVAWSEGGKPVSVTLSKRITQVR
ncbi:MAG: hypothetical protein JWP91_942 [Fibrobacteres bacterium]|nr:hypothetical protein [Fibrobacterota bacterium]